MTIVETEGVMERSYNRELPNEKKEDDRKLTWSNERLVKVEKSGQYVVRDEIANRMDEMAGSAKVGVRRGVTARFSPELVAIFK